MPLYCQTSGGNSILDEAAVPEHESRTANPSSLPSLRSGEERERKILCAFLPFCKGEARRGSVGGSALS